MQQTEALLEAWLKQRTDTGKAVAGHSGPSRRLRAVGRGDDGKRTGSASRRFRRYVHQGSQDGRGPDLHAADRRLPLDEGSAPHRARVDSEDDREIQDLDRRRSGDGLPFAVPESGWAAQQARPARHRSRDSSQRTALRVRPHTRGARTAISTVKNERKDIGDRGTSRSACCPISFLRD